MCMFRDESPGTGHPSPKTHPVSSPTLESDRVQISINDPRFVLSERDLGELRKNLCEYKSLV